MNPSYKIKLYGINSTFFDNKEDLEKYIQDNNLSYDDMYTMIFLGKVHGFDDVIKKIYKRKSILYTPSLIGYYYFDENEQKWKGSYGSLRPEYEEFRNRGIVFKNDIYNLKDILNKNISMTSNKVLKIDEKILRKIKR